MDRRKGVEMTGEKLINRDGKYHAVHKRNNQLYLCGCAFDTWLEVKRGLRGRLFRKQRKGCES